MIDWALSLAVFVLLALVLAPSLVFCVQIFAARFFASSKAVWQPSQTGRDSQDKLAVLIPAHNEASGIAGTIRSVLPQLQAQDLILVVADNCTDQTAAEARKAGAQVAERFNAVERGKGYALDHGVKALGSQGVTHVLMLDADCRLHPQSADALMQEVKHWGSPVQACDLMQAPTPLDVRTKVAEFAWRVKNKLRPLGSQALGWPCQLMGTGMIFPWSIIANAPLASGHLAEDMQLGARLARQGHLPRYCVRALVTSSFPNDQQAIQAQRTRWEHGHLGMITSHAMPLLRHGLQARSWPVIGMALDMAVPPLTTVILMNGGLLLVVATLTAAGWLHSGGSHLWLSLASSSLLAAAAIAAWRMEGRDLLSPHDLLSIPTYIVSKVSIYASYFTRRQTKWVRAKRDEGEP